MLQVQRKEYLRRSRTCTMFTSTIRT